VFDWSIDTKMMRADSVTESKIYDI
jgi:hypothetical protein